MSSASPWGGAPPPRLLRGAASLARDPHVNTWKVEQRWSHRAPLGASAPRPGAGPAAQEVVFCSPLTVARPAGRQGPGQGSGRKRWVRPPAGTGAAVCSGQTVRILSRVTFKVLVFCSVRVQLETG